jgi:membrane protease YdiL (CAAX protease family)
MYRESPVAARDAETAAANDRSALVSAQPSVHRTVDSPPLSRRTIVYEVLLVFALSLGTASLRAVLDLIGRLTARQPLGGQVAVLNASQAPQHPWLDLAYQLTSIAAALTPVFLVAYLLAVRGESLRTIGLDGSRPRADLFRGAALAALIGGTGLALYVGAHAAGTNVVIVPENLPDVWWRVPVLLLSAAQNAALEEILVVGYLLHRLRTLGWGDNRALLLSAVLRGGYHLYQGFGGFVGNVAMGLLFGRIFQRTGRTAPLVIAHTLIDSVAFVGYIWLHGRVSWLP